MLGLRLPVDLGLRTQTIEDRLGDIVGFRSHFMTETHRRLAFCGRWGYKGPGLTHFVFEGRWHENRLYAKFVEQPNAAARRVVQWAPAAGLAPTVVGTNGPNH